MKEFTTRYAVFKTNLGYALKLKKLPNGSYVSQDGMTLTSISAFNQNFNHQLPVSETSMALVNSDVVSVRVPAHTDDEGYKKERAFPLEEIKYYLNVKAAS
ncbi:hypothetical protein P7F88_03045 [Vibrio hannami]|uniref:hypothetical protein n=1 Tax=Vibrio hannami TaxID=2717094 RepID=UPI00240FCFD5|nr:hypothetical protein [Vibrio hannami]MDG3085129.1 hypothetical protein [Vibrio hannami]